MSYLGKPPRCVTSFRRAWLRHMSIVSVEVEVNAGAAEAAAAGTESNGRSASLISS